MAAPISIRLSDDVARALAELTADGTSRSEAVRTAVLDAARRRSRRTDLAVEARALTADPVDLEEMREVAGLMEALRAPW